MRVSELEQQSSETTDVLRATVDTRLDADDRLLTSLQKLSLELQKEDPEEQRDVARLREVCARLIKYTVEGIRTKLDRTYLEALQTAAQSPASLPASKDEMSALQEELESLYAEILPVAQMSVEQQHLEPALKGVAAKNGNATVRSRKGVEYVRFAAGSVWVEANLSDPIMHRISPTEPKHTIGIGSGLPGSSSHREEP